MRKGEREREQERVIEKRKEGRERKGFLFSLQLIQRREEERDVEVKGLSGILVLV